MTEDKFFAKLCDEFKNELIKTSNDKDYSTFLEPERVKKEIEAIMRYEKMELPLQGFQFAILKKQIPNKIQILSEKQKILRDEFSGYMKIFRENDRRYEEFKTFFLEYIKSPSARIGDINKDMARKCFEFINNKKENMEYNAKEAVELETVCLILKSFIEDTARKSNTNPQNNNNRQLQPNYPPKKIIPSTGANPLFVAPNHIGMGPMVDDATHQKEREKNRTNFEFFPIDKQATVQKRMDQIITNLKFPYQKVKREQTSTTTNSGSAVNVQKTLNSNQGSITQTQNPQGPTQSNPNPIKRPNPNVLDRQDPGVAKVLVTGDIPNPTRFPLQEEDILKKEIDEIEKDKGKVECKKGIEEGLMHITVSYPEKPHMKELLLIKNPNNTLKIVDGIHTFRLTRIFSDDSTQLKYIVRAWKELFENR